MGVRVANRARLADDQPFLLSDGVIHLTVCRVIDLSAKFSQQRALNMNAPAFCDCGDAQERLAVLGVFSQAPAENAALRASSRDT